MLPTAQQQRLTDSSGPTPNGILRLIQLHVALALRDPHSRVIWPQVRRLAEIIQTVGGHLLDLIRLSKTEPCSVSLKMKNRKKKKKRIVGGKRIQEEP